MDYAYYFITGSPEPFQNNKRGFHVFFVCLRFTKLLDFMLTHLNQALVIHVRSFTERAAHIEAMLKKHPAIPSYEYILDGDIDDITPSMLETYFATDSMMFAAKPFVSCTIKHLFAYEYIIKNNLDGALILEDDMVLFSNFDSVYTNSIMEYSKRFVEKPVLINYENTRLRFVPRSKRRTGVYLYQGDRDRMAGCYFINRHAAQLILDDVIKNKCRLPIDLYHNELIKSDKICYLWCQPTIAEQGSHNGLFRSEISSRQKIVDKMRWRFKVTYKQFLYWLR